MQSNGQLSSITSPLEFVFFGNPSGLDIAARYAGSIHGGNLLGTFFVSLPFAVAYLNGVDIVLMDTGYVGFYCQTWRRKALLCFGN